MDKKTYKCPKCGADVEIKNIENCVCDFCGAKITLSETDLKKFKKKKKKKTRKSVNKKNLIKIIFPIVILLVFALLVFTHTICLSHSYSEATIAKPQTCRHCGKIKGEPKEMVEISFPTKGIGALLPIPNSTVGELHWDDSNSFRVDIGNTTKEDFEAYINECMEAGFYVDYEKDNDSFFTHDSAGNYLSIYYIESDMIEIYIHD